MSWLPLRNEQRSIAALLALAGAVLVSTTVSDHVDAQAAGPRLIASVPVQRSGRTAFLPMTLVDGLPTVEMMVNGRGPFRFAIDTGQPFALSVTPDTADTLGLERTGQTLIGDPSGGTTREIPTFRARSMVLGGLTFTDVAASAAAMARPGRSALSGTIGMALFDGLTLTIDYGRSRMSVEPAPLPKPDGERIVQARIDDMGLTEVPLTIGETVYQVHLDTGNARFGLFMPADLIARLPTRGTARAIGVARTVGGEVALRAIGLAAPVRVGATRLPVTAVGYPAVAPIGNIGSAALAGVALSIDTRSHRVRIVPSRSEPGDSAAPR